MAQAPSSVANYLHWARQPRSAIWLHLLAVPLLFLLWQVSEGPLMILVNNRYPEDSPEAAALLPMTFLGPFLVLLLTVRLLFGPPAWRVALPGWPPRWADYGSGLLIGWVMLSVTYLVLSGILDISYQGWGTALNASATMLVILLVGLVVQTAFEELYFRGVLMQATYRITRWIPVVIGIQALLFAQLHSGNIKSLGGGVEGMIPYLFPAVGFGYVAWRTGSLLMSMALHFANNSFATMVVGAQGDVISGPAPWVSVPTLGGMVSFAAVYWLLVIVAVELLVRRRARGSAHAAPSPSAA